MTTAELNAKREQRFKLITDARAILDRAKAENRATTTEEDQQYNRLFDDAKKIKLEIEAGETSKRAEDRERELADEERELSESRGRKAGPDRIEGNEQRTKEADKPFVWERRDANGQVVRYRYEKGSEESHDAWARSSDSYRDAFFAMCRHGRSGLNADERRALAVSPVTSGGYTVPTQMGAQIIKAVDDQVFIRQLATVIPLPNAESLGNVTLDNDPADFDWTAELGTGSEDSTMSMGKRELRPYALAKRIKVSDRLLRLSSIDIESFVIQRLAYKEGITQEKAFLTGNGSQRPLGLFTASTEGIPTSRDISTGNTTTAIGADNLFTVKYTLKPQYRARSRWLFHRDAVAQLAKLKDGEGQYLWQPSLQDDQPDRLIGRPVTESEYVPNTFTQGLYVGMLADFSYYWIVDSLARRMQRLEELYAETNQVGFIVRSEVDAKPVLSEAFVRVTLA